MTTKQNKPKKTTAGKKTATPKPAKKAKPLVGLDMPVYVLYGRDENGKPRASRFPNYNPDLVSTAARVMGYRMATTSYAETPEILKRLPAGKIYADNKALAPPVSEDTYELISKAVGGDLGKISIALPRSWDELEPQVLVLAQDNATNGWFEAVVIERTKDFVRIKWRDHPLEEPITRHMDHIALICQPTPSS